MVLFTQKCPGGTDETGEAARPDKNALSLKMLLVRPIALMSRPGLNEIKETFRPGLAVRVICANEPYKAKDYDRTVILLRNNMLLQQSHVACKDYEQFRVLHENVRNTLTLEEVDFLERATKEYVIAGHVLPIRAISRVAYAFGPVVKHEIEFITETTLVPFHVVSKIQAVDAIAQKVLWDSGSYLSVAQMPVILIPVVFDEDTVDPAFPGRKHSVVLRPFISNDFMTGIAALPGKHIPKRSSTVWVILKMVTEIQKVGGISRVLYDLTCKPPGTTEWE
ncbi:putative GMP synthase (glutamine-hydrolyzing) [Hypsibius exemplaris]|uniref:GMP synthase (Glutamine-hydrolyzing) n=1 Tax=Hypsibius exemplaris TaxID=2072580 RepID=A0A1W0WUA6_HYPEX|nr:putative GMP synthase (glutamine-hydrolyzing) [Hypsibius exemplaris]